MSNPQPRPIQPDVRQIESSVAPTFSAFQPMADISMTLLKNANRMQSEMLRFMSERMEKDIAHSARLLSCKSPTDYVQAQMDFLRVAVDDYTREGRRVNDVMTSVLNDASSSMGRVDVSTSKPMQ